MKYKYKLETFKTKIAVKSWQNETSLLRRTAVLIGFYLTLHSLLRTPRTRRWSCSCCVTIWRSGPRTCRARAATPTRPKVTIRMSRIQALNKCFICWIFKKNLLGLEGVWSLGWSDFEKEKAMLCQIVEGPQIQNFMS